MRIIMALTILALASAVTASELPVNYLVEVKPFKRDVTVGDPLTFELHGDPNCASVLYSEPVVAGTSALILEKVSTDRVRGQKPRPPKGLRLIATLSPSGLEGQLFLRVVANGVVPLDGECQAQAAGVPSAAAQELRVFDGEGNDLGQLVSGSNPVVTLYHDGIGALYKITTIDGQRSGERSVIQYDEPGCQGQAYIEDPRLSDTLIQNGNPGFPPVYFVTIPGVTTSVVETVSTFDNNQACTPQVMSIPKALPVREVTQGELGTTFPVPLPLTFGPAD